MSFSNLDTFGQQASDVRAVQLPFVPGQVVSTSYLSRLRDLINANPQATDIWTLTITGGTTAGSSVIATIAGQVITYTSQPGDTSTTILATSFAAFINGNPIVRGVAAATSTGASAVVTITGIQPGQAFTVTAGTNTGSATHTQTAASAALVPYGVAVAYIPGSSTIDGPAQYCGLMTDSLFTAQVATVTVVYAANQEYTVTIGLNGKVVSAVALANTDSATTATDLATAINTAMDAAFTAGKSVVAAATSGGALTLTAEVLGFEFTVATGVLQNPTSNIALAYTTGPSISTSAVQAFAGVSVFAVDQELTTVGGSSAGYPGNAGLRALQFGHIGVANSDNVALGDKVYEELDHTSANAGLLFNATGDTRVLLPGQYWERNAGYAAQGADSYAVVSINVTR